MQLFDILKTRFHYLFVCLFPFSKILWFPANVRYNIELSFWHERAHHKNSIAIFLQNLNPYFLHISRQFYERWLIQLSVKSIKNSPSCLPFVSPFVISPLYFILCHFYQFFIPVKQLLYPYNDWASNTFLLLLIKTHRLFNSPLSL